MGVAVALLVVPGTDSGYDSDTVARGQPPGSQRASAIPVVAMSLVAAFRQNVSGSW
jgi:hypothetical protein